VEKERDERRQLFGGLNTHRHTSARTLSGPAGLCLARTLCPEQIAKLELFQKIEVLKRIGLRLRIYI
jgi:hypothetical protein